MKNFLGTGPSRDGTVPVPGGTASQKRDGGGTVPEPSWDSPGTGRSWDRPGRDVRNTNPSLKNRIGEADPKEM